MVNNRVILMPSPPMMTSASWSALRRKRRTIWHNWMRNRLVARVAKASLAQDKQELRSLGIRWRDKQGIWTHRVVVLVESTEHAKEMSKLLRDWEVLDTRLGEEPVEEDGDRG